MEVCPEATRLALPNTGHFRLASGGDGNTQWEANLLGVHLRSSAFRAPVKEKLGSWSSCKKDATGKFKSVKIKIKYTESFEAEKKKGLHGEAGKNNNRKRYSA